MRRGAGARAAGIPTDYGRAIEPWAVRRFFMRDPVGTLINLTVRTGAQSRCRVETLSGFPEQVQPDDAPAGTPPDPKPKP